MRIGEKSPLVIDKSFLQAACSCLGKRADLYDFVVTSAFYFELFNPLNGSARAILRRLGTFRRIHTPFYRRDEWVKGEPVLPVDTGALTVNPRVISGERCLREFEEQLQKGYENELLNPEIEFWRDVTRNGVLGFEDVCWRNVRKHPSINLMPLFDRLRDDSFIRSVAKQISFPHYDALSADWFFYRFLQTRLMHGLYLYACYPDPLKPRKDRDLEHDVHDMDYLALGLFLRSFATNESQQDFRKLGWRFKFLCPDGELISHINCPGEEEMPDEGGVQHPPDLEYRLS